MPAYNKREAWDDTALRARERVIFEEVWKQMFTAVPHAFIGSFLDLRELVIDSPILKKYGISYINSEITRYVSVANEKSKAALGAGIDPSVVLDDYIRQLTEIIELLRDGKSEEKKEDN